MFLNEMYSRVHAGKNLTDMFPIEKGLKYGNNLLPLFLNIVLVCATRGVLVNQDSLTLNGTHQLWVYADDVNILGGSVHTIKKNTDTLVVARKETGLEVNADRTKYMVMS
jgi:hypothetical protein